MNITRYVNAAFVLAALLIYAVFSKFLTALWSIIPLIKNYPILGARFTLTDVLAIAVAGISGVLLWRHERVNKLANEIAVELRKVTWPTRKETVASTIVVIVVTILISLFLGFFDLIWAWITGLIYGE